MSNLKLALFLLLSLVLSPSSVDGQEPQCLVKDDFVIAGPDGPIVDTLVVESDNGPVIYAAGLFDLIDGERMFRVARWDGTRWQPLTGLALISQVQSLAMFDDGNGPTLYAAGSFYWQSFGSASAARWNGSAWLPVGPGFQMPKVTKLAVIDDHSGSSLYMAGSGNESGLYRWQAGQWNAVGTGLRGTVEDVLFFDGPSGPSLYIAGVGLTVDNQNLGQALRWNGAGWEAIDNTEPLLGQVTDLLVFDSGNGPRLHAAGNFQLGDAAPGVARLDAQGWSRLGAPMDQAVNRLETVDFGAGPRLFAAGDFTMAGTVPASHLAIWSGNDWQGVATGLDKPVFSLAGTGFGADAKLLVGGDFGQANGLAANRLAQWDGSQWTAVGSADHLGQGLSDTVMDLVEFDDGSGRAIYATGNFTQAGGRPISYIGRWNGSSWSPVGEGLNGSGTAITVFDDGSGAKLYVASELTRTGETPVVGVAAWDGQSWTPVGPKFDGQIQDFHIFDDGQGEALYAAGDFRHSGTEEVNGVAKWDGGQWQALGSGLLSAPGGTVLTLGDFDQGSGDRLYAGGRKFDGSQTSALARWDGHSWQILDVSPWDAVEVRDLESARVFADRVSLVAAGTFTRNLTRGLPDQSAESGAQFYRAAVLSDDQWLAIDQPSHFGGPRGTALVHFNDGTGSALYMGSNLDILKWQQGQWHSVARAWGEVMALLDSHVGGLGSLLVGGSIDQLQDQFSVNMGNYSCAQSWVFTDGFESGDFDAWSKASP